MIIVMQAGASTSAVQHVVETIEKRGLQAHLSQGKERIIIGAVGDERVFDVAQLESLAQVERAIRIVPDWRMISRELWQQDTEIVVRGVCLGGQESVCYFASSDSELLEDMHEQGVLLDPFYLPLNPYAVSGCLNESTIAHQLLCAAEHYHRASKVLAVRIRDAAHIQAALDAPADFLYLGGELLENRRLLHELGSLNVPIIICKGKQHSVREWLLAAEQIVLRGNIHVILGEEGAMGMNDFNLRLDVEAWVQAKKLSHLPVLVNLHYLVNRYMDASTLEKIALAAGIDAIVR